MPSISQENAVKYINMTLLARTKKEENKNETNSQNTSAPFFLGGKASDSPREVAWGWRRGRGAKVQLVKREQLCRLFDLQSHGVACGLFLGIEPKQILQRS